MYRWMIVVMLTCLTGCATVSVERTSVAQSVAEQRSDMLSAGQLSTTSVRVLAQAGLLSDVCARAFTVY